MNSRFATGPAALLAAALVAALVPGLAQAANCTAAVAPGFNGDVDALYGTDYGGGAGDGSGGDSGGAGAGAGEGKVLGATMTLTRLSDGVVLGSATTDSVRGLVTIRPCQGDLPALLTLSVRAGAQYFDEGTNTLVTFNPTGSLHALVDAFDENVGVSPLTEAAYRYALNNFVLNPADVRAGRVPLASSGNATGLTMAQVKAANAIVLAEFNRGQSTGMRLATLKSLPTPIDAGANAGALPGNRYGVAATVLGGLAAMGRTYATTSAAPALATSEQLARDLTDGKLDGFALDGSPASGAAVPAYDPVRFPVAAAVGANAIGARFGAATTLAFAPDIAELTSMSGSSWLQCSGSAETATLRKDASVTLTRTSCGGGASAPIPNFATDVRLVEGIDTGDAPRTFLVKKDGSVHGWGDTLCGLLGNGETAQNFRSAPVKLANLADVTGVAIGRWFSLARDAGGNVWAWGINYGAQLGLGVGSNAPGATACRNVAVPAGDVEFANAYVVTTPTKVPNLADILSVSADADTAFAIDRAGNLYRWGFVFSGYNFANTGTYYHGEYTVQATPAKVAGLPPAVSAVSSNFVTLVLGRDGSVWGFGVNVSGNLGDGTRQRRLTPVQVPGLSDVVEIAGSVQSPFVALQRDGTIRWWGGCCTDRANQTNPNVRTTPTTPVPGATPIWTRETGTVNGTLPAIRHLRSNGGAVLLYGVDGSIWQFPRSPDFYEFAKVAAAAAAPAGTKAVAVEYYNAGFDHYFVTQIADEIAKLDNGTFVGWARTGATFNVFGDAPAGSVPVCRFFSTAFGSKSSHFYTPDAAECAKVKANAAWQFEAEVFRVPAADAAGNCPAGTQPVYRLYNNGQGAAPNHRYTTSLATRTQMLGKGWIPEGYGALGVIMCSPQ